jgi:hypothetical protein
MPLSDGIMKLTLIAMENFTFAENPFNLLSRSKVSMIRTGLISRKSLKFLRKLNKLHLQDKECSFSLKKEMSTYLKFQKSFLHMIP